MGKDKQVHKTGWETGQETTVVKVRADYLMKQNNSPNKTNKPALRTRNSDSLIQ